MERVKLKREPGVQTMVLGIKVFVADHMGRRYRNGPTASPIRPHSARTPQAVR